MAKKVLIVDDDYGIRDTLHRLLARHGYEVREAANGFIAMEMLTDGAFDVVIADYMMRGMNGIELIEEIQVNWPTIPLVLLTAYLSADTAKTMLMGRAHFIAKPVTLTQLITAIRQLVPVFIVTLQVF